MASDYLLVMTGIPGESLDTAFPASVEIQSFSWGVSNPGSSSTGGGAGTGKANFQDISFSTTVNKSTPKLFSFLVLGTHIATAVFHLRKQGKDGQQEYLTYTFSDCVVSSLSHGGGGGGEVTESFSLNYTKFEISYKPQKADQTLDTAIEAGYDMKATKKV